MTNLSPTTQAVLDAAKEAYWLWDQMCPAEADAIAVAVLRAAADQIVPVEDELIDDCWYEKKNPVRDQLLAIATELEQSN